MTVKRGRPRKEPLQPAMPIAQATSPEPLKIVMPPKPRRRLQSFEGSKFRDVVELADNFCERWPKTSEALYAAAWIYAKEMYDECAPKIEDKS